LINTLLPKRRPYISKMDLDKVEFGFAICVISSTVSAIVSVIIVLLMGRRGHAIVDGYSSCSDSSGYSNSSCDFDEDNSEDEPSDKPEGNPEDEPKAESESNPKGEPTEDSDTSDEADMEIQIRDARSKSGNRYDELFDNVNNGISILKSIITENLGNNTELKATLDAFSNIGMLDKNTVTAEKMQETFHSLLTAIATANGASEGEIDETITYLKSITG
jgi:ribosome-binding protein aMBF1 (putative translation factor)